MVFERSTFSKKAAAERSKSVISLCNREESAGSRKKQGALRIPREERNKRGHPSRSKTTKEGGGWKGGE
jgi:hypothetical protein